MQVPQAQQAVGHVVGVVPCIHRPSVGGGALGGSRASFRRRVEKVVFLDDGRRFALVLFVQPFQGNVETVPLLGILADPVQFVLQGFQPLAELQVLAFQLFPGFPDGDTRCGREREGEEEGR